MKKELGGGHFDGNDDVIAAEDSFLKDAYTPRQLD